MIDGFSSRNVRIELEFDDPFAKYKGLHISRTQVGYNIRGSVHKYHNNGEHNADDYCLSDFAETLNQMFEEMGLNPDIAPLCTFEFGVNIKLPTSPQSVLKRLILHRSGGGSTRGLYKEFEYSEYILKIYDKSGIEQSEDDILRIEIKIKKMRYIRDKRKIYVRMLSDLLDVAIWERLEDVLINAIEECLIIEMNGQEVDALTDKQKIQYYKYINPNFWHELHKESRQKYHRERKRCDKFINVHSKSRLKQDIISHVRQKCSELRDLSEVDESVKKWDKITTLQSWTKQSKTDEITIKIKGEFVSPGTPGQRSVKYCLTCGRIIENPRKGQKYCSAKDVGYSQAHKCRNSASNPKNNTRRTIERIISIPLLFDLSETIAPEKRKFYVG